MTGDQAGDIDLMPLVAMNPMGKDHVPALLDQYLALDADGLAARVASGVATKLAHVPDDFKVSLTICDDAVGGWTNRHFTDFSHRFASKPAFRRGWLTGLLWTSETPSTQRVREATLMPIYRGAYIQQHGFARTLREMLAQEGYVMTQSDAMPPTLGAEELAYTREVIAPHLDAHEQPTVMACLYGDEIASSLGYPSLGLSPHAGFAWALHEARENRGH